MTHIILLSTIGSQVVNGWHVGLNHSNLKGVSQYPHIYSNYGHHCYKNDRPVIISTQKPNKSYLEDRYSDTTKPLVPTYVHVVRHSHHVGHTRLVMHKRLQMKRSLLLWVKTNIWINHAQRPSDSTSGSMYPNQSKPYPQVTPKHDKSET